MSIGFHRTQAVKTLGIKKFRDDPKDQAEWEKLVGGYPRMTEDDFEDEDEDEDEDDELDTEDEDEDEDDDDFDDFDDEDDEDDD